MKKKLSTRDKILNYLKNGYHLTSIGVLNLLGTTEIRSRIAELRKAGYNIQDRWVERNGKRFKEYYIPKEELTKGDLTNEQ
jgi:hypothetical protein